MTRSDLQQAVLDALINLGGTASVTQIAKEIWRLHEAELRNSGDLFYTWQYDMRWAGQRLQQRKLIRKSHPGRFWSLVRQP